MTVACTISEFPVLVSQHFSRAMRISSAFLAATSIIALSALYYLVTLLRLKRKATALGCKSVPFWRARDVLGITWSLTMVKAMKENRLSQQFDSMFKEVQEREGRECTTFQAFLPPGQRFFFTSDPRNMQAVLATQFKDFQLPLSRLAAFRILLGQGIVSDICRNLIHYLTAIVFI